MKIYNSYILIVAVLLLLTTVILAVMRQEALDVYYTIYIIEALVVTELYVYFNPKGRRALSLLSATLFGGFLFVVSLEVIKILG